MEKIKNWIRSEQGKDILVILIVILVGLGSFELGRLSKSDSSSTGIKIEYPAESANASGALEANNLTQNLPKYDSAPKPKTQTSVIYFASKRGHKYYPMDCSAGKTIKMENRIYFDTRGQAEAAGYALSASCQ